ncbi:DUF6238 family protein [Streptomyces aidingensis]|uniref:Uncharacterized protein n=1 Tax=Streptomyces aidingensis TaxID=910347 RepID=A0A1I1KFV8_9ACTN|nr:DUF6238 family protein [Streptomyces aidingensis]SFC59699.1 hypothetical protein SAMN05421773_104219 [Streptomyces aidingensis]
MPPTDTVSDFIPYATAAVDFHRALNVPAGSLAAGRAELDSLHAHLISLHGLFDLHTARTAITAPREADHLRAVRTRLWQAAEHLHAAYHAAPRPGTGQVPDAEACRARLPEGAPELTVCQRHLRTAIRVRRQTTPADLHDPFTGLTRH